MICEKCGTFNNDDAVFCTTCGADLKNQAPVAPAAPVQQPPYQQNPYQNPYQQNPYQQNPYQQNPYQSAPAAQESTPGKGLAVVAMIMGIASLVFCCLYVVSWIPAVLGIIFGAIAKSKGCTSGMATAGIVLGAIGLGLVLLMVIGVASLFSSELMYYY